MQEVMREDQGLYRQEFEHDNCGIMIQLQMHSES